MFGSPDEERYWSLVGARDCTLVRSRVSCRVAPAAGHLHYTEADTRRNLLQLDREPRPSEPRPCSAAFQDVCNHVPNHVEAQMACHSCQWGVMKWKLVSQRIHGEQRWVREYCTPNVFKTKHGPIFFLQAMLFRSGDWTVSCRISTNLLFDFQEN